MKKIILFVILFFTSFTISQTLSKDSTVGEKKEKVVEKKIDSIMVRNQEDAKLIKAVAEENHGKMKNIKEIDERQELVVDRLLSYFKKNKNKPKVVEVKQQLKTVIKKVPVTIFVKQDSVCVETSRAFLGKKKCIKWEKI